MPASQLSPVRASHRRSALRLSPRRATGWPALPAIIPRSPPATEPVWRSEFRPGLRVVGWQVALPLRGATALTLGVRACGTQPWLRLDRRVRPLWGACSCLGLARRAGLGGWVRLRGGRGGRVTLIPNETVKAVQSPTSWKYGCQGGQIIYRVVYDAICVGSGENA